MRRTATRCCGEAEHTHGFADAVSGSAVCEESDPQKPCVTQPFIFAASTATGAKTVQDIVNLAKQRPGKLNFASAGVGSSNHLLGEIFMASTGTEFEHVPYKGGASARDAVAKNEFKLTDEVLSLLIGNIRAGHFDLLFTTSDVRPPLFPDVPTAVEPAYRTCDRWFLRVACAREDTARDRADAHGR